MSSRQQDSPLWRGGQGVALFPAIIDPRGLLRPEAPITGAFHLTMPVRRIPPKRRSIAGAVPFPHLGRNIGFESSLERDLLLILRQGDLSFAVIEQPIRLQLKALGLKRGIYTADFLVWTWNHGGIAEVTLVEVKPEEILRKDYQNLKKKIIAGIRFAKRQGWHFCLITERHLRLPATQATVWPRIHTPMQQLCEVDDLMKRLRLMRHL